ncbi:PilZ domain-containing protein [Aquabacterium sp.]|uniref:PilZ domain-containing protein n=1 Tax=Aquabacterium sp. TaxID=1872578 RepID=UPI003D6CF480
MSRLPHLANDSADSTGDAASGASRRIHARLAVRRTISLVMADGSTRVGTTVDVSQLGLSLSTDKPIAPGSRCQVRFEGQAGGPPESIELGAKAVYSSYTSPRNFRIGVVFIDTKRVTAFLQALMGEQLAASSFKNTLDKS